MRSCFAASRPALGAKQAREIWFLISLIVGAGCQKAAWAVKRQVLLDFLQVLAKWAGQIGDTALRIELLIPVSSGRKIRKIRPCGLESCLPNPVGFVLIRTTMHGYKRN